MQPYPELHPSVVSEKPADSLGTLIGDLAEQSAALVRDELVLVRRELSAEAKEIINASVLLLVGGLIAMTAALTLVAALILGLAPLLGSWQTALLVGLLLLVPGALCLLSGLKKLKAASLIPHQMLGTLRENTHD